MTPRYAIMREMAELGVQFKDANSCIVIRDLLVSLREENERLKSHPNPTVDRNVESVKANLDARAAVGFRKYGVTTERTDLSLLDWLKHAQMEAMDQVVYLEAAIQKIEKGLA